MPSKKPFYITTTLPYVNSDPHIGHALEFVRADVIARYKRERGNDVFFNTGTDEHGVKIYQTALKEGVDINDFVNKYSDRFKTLVSSLNLSNPNFTRTTDVGHIEAAKEMWKRCEAAGDIYKKLYKIKYCIGCELEKTDSELVDGKCHIHPNLEIEIREEENYFFKFSNYQDKLLSFYKENPEFVIPDFRFNEIKAFVERGLEDFSISRLKSKMPWGVEVPGDEDHVMYVWFDALTSYISSLGWPNEGNFEKYWLQNENEKREVVQYCGKDNLRQQSAIWQAMLMSAGISNSTNIIINGFINSGGQKMSKSTGNVIDPLEVIETFKSVTDYPEDVLRFVLLHEISSFEDGDVTLESIKQAYTVNLVNGIGNTTSRIMKMIDLYREDFLKYRSTLGEGFTFNSEIENHLERFDIKRSLEILMGDLQSLDALIQKDEAFKVIKQDLQAGLKLIDSHYRWLHGMALSLGVFLPRTSAKILECIGENKMPEKPLFARLA